jgi:hypothetical protein
MTKSEVETWRVLTIKMMAHVKDHKLQLSFVEDIRSCRKVAAAVDKTATE